MLVKQVDAKMNIEEIKEEQIRLARKIVVKDDFKKIETIAGCDQAFCKRRIISAVVVCDRNMNVVEQAAAEAEEKFPYIPGLLFYREGLAAIDAFRKLSNKPDVLIVDANGILHPLRIGMASHLGLILDTPTIGVSKNLVLGKIEDGKVLVGNEVRAVEVITKEHARPLYVSPGHRISLETSVDIVKQFMKPPHKLPEPLHLAHRLAEKTREEAEKAN